jgi:hypothetical protein
MSHNLPRTLQAVPNTLHARLEIADAIRKLGAADQEDWARWRREELAALRRDVEGFAETSTQPTAGVTTNYIYAECAVEIWKMGGRLIAGRNFVFGRLP